MISISFIDGPLSGKRARLYETTEYPLEVSVVIYESERWYVYKYWPTAVPSCMRWLPKREAASWSERIPQWDHGDVWFKSHYINGRGKIIS